MSANPPRTHAARAAAEEALVRIVHHYGAKPEFVVLGGLVPQLLCSTSPFDHAGTTDIDVQVDLEVTSGSVNTERLETALRNAEFEPDSERSWRWESRSSGGTMVVKFELLADLDDMPGEATISFDDCQELGAVNLRGTGFAARDVTVHELFSRVGGVPYSVAVNVTGLAGFLLAKCAAARARRLPKDWYDIAFVLLHNQAGGVGPAANAVLERFGHEVAGALRYPLDDLLWNFADHDSQGPTAYATQMQIDHPHLDALELRADAILAVESFHERLTR